MRECFGAPDVVPRTCQSKVKSCDGRHIAKAAADLKLNQKKVRQNVAIQREMAMVTKVRENEGSSSDFALTRAGEFTCTRGPCGATRKLQEISHCSYGIE